MCARLLACPLCSQPGFLTLDALRAGLISVATRPLICPVCNEMLLGIDKLTIHLFGHTINLNHNSTESLKRMDVVTPDEHPIAVHNAYNIALQSCNILKTQQSDKAQFQQGDNSRICTEPSNSSISITTENKSSIIDSQPQTQNQDLSLKDLNQHTSFVSDLYNYDVIKVNILSESNENRNAALRPIPNLQEVLKTNCTMQYSCNNDIKCLNISQENTEAEKTTTSDFLHNWIEEQSCKVLATTKAMRTVNTDIYENVTKSECMQLNNNQHVTKERLMMNLIGKENDLPDFESIQNAMPIYADNTLLEVHNKQSLCNAKQIMLERNAEVEERNMQEQRKISSHAQICTKIFETIAPKEKTERCNICGFHFSDANILALHQQLVHEQDKHSNSIPGKILKNYSCHLCCKVFKMRGSLMIHMRVAHIGHNLGTLSKDDQIELIHGNAGYNCPTCGKKFKKEQHVIQHLKTHEGKQWECDICSKMFTTKYFLKKHKRLHSGEMPYKCKICDKNFTFQQSYHKHRLYHKDDKPHTCATCGRSFKELSTLHNHERIHTGEKPFACETCGKCFRQRVSYLVHRRIHTGVMPYKCTMCDKSFRYKVSQRTHKCSAQISENAQQSSIITQEANDKLVNLQSTIDTLQENQSSMSNAVDKEANKFVLTINSQGQHVLTLESDINISSEKSKRNIKFQNASNTNKDSKIKTHYIENFNTVILEESPESNKKIKSGNEKIKNTNNLPSLVMSHFENSISSPIIEMEHLRVSSPKQRENSIDPYINFPQIFDNAQINTVKSNDRNVSDSLQTINEESLKELLYGIDGK